MKKTSRRSHGYHALIKTWQKEIQGKRFLTGLVLLAAAFFGLRTYFIVKPVNYPVNHDPAWNQGKLVHILPTVSHERFLIKTSFEAPLGSPPVLEVDGFKTVAGAMTDTEGRFWRFDVAGLSSDTEYQLSLKSRTGEKLCDS